MPVSLFPVKCVRLCTYLCGLVHFSYLLLCISLWLRVSIYYDTMRRYTCIHLLLLSLHMKCALFGSTRSSLLISTTVASFLHLCHKFPPTHLPTLLKPTRFPRNSPSIAPTALPYPFLVLVYHITHYILLYYVHSIVIFSLLSTFRSPISQCAP